MLHPPTHSVRQQGCRGCEVPLHAFNTSFRAAAAPAARARLAAAATRSPVTAVEPQLDSTTRQLLDGSLQQGVAVVEAVSITAVQHSKQQSAAQAAVSNGQEGSDSGDTRTQQGRRAHSTTASGLSLNPTLVPPRPWAEAALHAVADTQDTAAAGGAATAAAAAAGAAAETSAGSSPAAASPPDPGAGFVEAILSQTRGKQKPADRSSSSSSEGWSDAFVEDVLAAVAAVTSRQRPADSDSSSSTSSSGSAGVWDEPLDVAQQQQQQQEDQQAPQERWRSQQQSDASRGESLMSDARVTMLLSLLHTQEASEQQQLAGRAGQQAYSSSSSGQYVPSSSSAAASAGWGYSSGAQVPRLQRVQWMVEELHRLRLLADSTAAAAAAYQVSQGSSSPLGAARLQHGSQQQQPGSGQQQQQQQHLHLQQEELLQQQHQVQSLSASLRLQVHKLLLAFMMQDATSWRCILTVVEDYSAVLNPALVAGALHALQAMFNDDRRPRGSDRGRATRLLHHLLDLVLHWQHSLGPREVVSVLWTLARLQHKRYLKLQQYAPLRDALCRQYQQHVLSMAPQLTMAAHSQQPQQQQQQQQQHQLQSQQQHQQQQQPFQSWSLFVHGAVLLACARLRLRASTALQPGTSTAICKVAVAHLVGMRQQLKQHPGSVTVQQQAAVLASHTALLLYGMSELGLIPTGSLLRCSMRFTRVLLQHMAPADVAMLAVAYGRFGVTPNKWWRNALLRVTAAAAHNAVAAAASATPQLAAVPAAAWVEHGSVSSAAQLQAASVAPAPASGASLQSVESGCVLNAADISSLLTAAHSMNLAPPARWVESLFEASLSQLQDFSLWQSLVLVLSISKLQVVPQLQWLLKLTQHVLQLTSSSTGAGSNAVDFSSGSGNSSSSSSSSSSSNGNGSTQQATIVQQHELVSHQAGVLQQPSAAARLLRQQQLQLQQQYQQQHQQHEHQQQHQQQHQQHPVRYVHQPNKRLLCLYLLALSKATALLPEEQQAPALQQLRPLAAAAATRVAAAWDKLQPLDLVQLLLGLQQLGVRPGPSFMASFAARCEGQQVWFTPSMYKQLRVAYAGLGLMPPASLRALMVAAQEHGS